MVTDVLRRAKQQFERKLLGYSIDAFWWRGEKNFGDLFTPELIKKFGYRPKYAPRRSADLIGVGSLVQLLPSDYEGIILGSGLIKDVRMNLEKADFAAVRGELTKNCLGLPPATPTGDLGLLAACLIDDEPIAQQFSVGVVPHFYDKGHPWITEALNELGSSGSLIDVQESARATVKRISKCDVIVSSSLHGIIAADALGIPNVWIELSDKVVGQGFKFHDYNSCIDYEQPACVIGPATAVKEIEKQASNKSFVRISEKIRELEGILSNVLLRIYQEKNTSTVRQ